MRLRSSLIALALVVSASQAWAQSPAEIAAAKQAFKEGDEAEKRRDLPTAAAKFKEAIAVKETPQLVLRLGGVQEKMGLLAQAMQSYERGMERAQAQNLTPVAKVAREQMEAMRARVPTVVVTVAKAYPDLVVTLDGKTLALGTKTYLDPGDHKVVAEANGYQKKEKPFAAVERDALEFQLDLAPVGGPAPVTGPVEAPVADNAPGPSRVPAIVLYGGGAAAIGAGVVLFIVAAGKDSTITQECGGDRDHCDVPKSVQTKITGQVSTVNTFQTVGAISLGVGAAAIGVGTYFLLRKPSPSAEKPAEGLRVYPLVGPTTAGAGFSGSF